MHNSITIGATSTGLNEVVDTFALDTGLFLLAFILVVVHMSILAKQADEPDHKAGLILLNALGLLVSSGMFIFISKTF